MGLAPIYQKPRSKILHPEHRVCRYLLRWLTIDKPDQVWCSDITCISKLAKGRSADQMGLELEDVPVGGASDVGGGDRSCLISAPRRDPCGSAKLPCQGPGSRYAL